jgi:hypothetical protein
MNVSLPFIEAGGFFQGRVFRVVDRNCILSEKSRILTEVFILRRICFAIMFVGYLLMIGLRFGGDVNDMGVIECKRLRLR